MTEVMVVGKSFVWILLVFGLTLTGCDEVTTLIVENPTDESVTLPFGAAFVEGWCPKGSVLRVRIKTLELEALTQVESREGGTRFGVYAPLTHGRVEIEVDAGEAGSVQRAFTQVADTPATARDLALASLAAWRGGWLKSWELERHLDPHRDSVSAQLAELLPRRAGQNRAFALALMTNIPPRDAAARDAVLEKCRPVLVETWQASDPHQRLAVTRLLAAYGSPGAVALARETLGAEDGELVLAFVLRGIRNYPSVWCTRSYLVDRMFDRMLGSEDELMHALGAYAVYRWRGDASPLRAKGGLDVLESSEIPALREMAAYGMHVLGRDVAIPRLEKLLKDPADNVQVEAWWALGKLGR